MSEEEGAVDYELDSISRSVRFVAGALPAAATRVGLGLALAVDDAAHDEAAELLGAKVAQGAAAIGGTVQVAGRVIGKKASSAVSSLKAGYRAGAERLSASKESLAKLPALKGAGDLAGQALSELRQSWDAAGRIQVQVVDEASVLSVEEAASVEEAGQQQEEVE